MSDTHMPDTKQRQGNDYVVCVHHGTDLDGWTAAALVKRWAEEQGLQPFFFPMNHNAPVRCQEIIEAFRPRYFIVADYSLTPAEYRELNDSRCDLESTCRFLWCDHHISAVRDWNKAGYISDEELEAFERGEQVMVGEVAYDTALLCRTQSGCRLLHKMLFPKEYLLPPFVFYVDRYDVWDMDPDIRPDAEALQLACKVYDVENPSSVFWKEVIYPPIERTVLRTEELLHEGRRYKAYQIKLDEAAMRTLSFTVDWHGHTWLAANSTGNSQVADSVFDPDVHDGVLLFSYIGGEKPWKISMYSHESLPEERKKTLDFSVIAKEYGGGGHPGACGFVCEKLPFIGQQA